MQRGRVLEKMAYISDGMVPGLSLHSIRWKPERKMEKIQKRDDCIPDQWLVAWGKLDVCYMGRTEWAVSGDWRPDGETAQQLQKETWNPDTKYKLETVFRNHDIPPD